MRQRCTGRLGPADGLLRFIPINEIEELRARAVHRAVRPFCVSHQWPAKPVLVVALGDRMSVERGPAIHVTFVAAALHEQRPEVTALTVAFRRVPLGVTKKWPHVVFVDAVSYTHLTL